jgi:hypothetical protein
MSAPLSSSCDAASPRWASHAGRSRRSPPSSSGTPRPARRSASTRSRPPTDRSHRSRRRRAARAARRPSWPSAAICPRGVPLLKRVLGLPGQPSAAPAHHHRRRRRDGRGARARPHRPRSAGLAGLPRIADGEVFLMNWEVRDSLDGRYFGPLPRQFRHRPRAPALDRRGRRRPLRLARADAVTRASRERCPPMAFPPPPQRRHIHATDRSIHARRIRLRRRSARSRSTATRHRSGRPSDAENAPDYRVHVSATSNDGPEIGAGWKRTGEKAGEYVSVLLDDPAFRSRSAPTCSATTTVATGRCTGAARRSAEKD